MMAKGSSVSTRAMDTNYKWPEYGEMIGGWFDQHPWFTFNAPIVLEDPNFPAVRHFPQEFVKTGRNLPGKSWSRDKVNVLLSLDASKLDYAITRAFTGRTATLQWRGRRCTAMGAFFIPPWAIRKKLGTIRIFRRCTSRQSSGYWA